MVMVVDDDQVTTRTLQGIMQNAGFRTVCAHDVSGAAALAEAQTPDLILLDVHLPDGSGIDFCRRLHSRASTSEIPILFISANDDVTLKIAGFDAGGVDYITKPLVSVEILARVRTHLRLRQAYQRLSELQAERLRSLKVSQQALMPQPQDYPEARFQVALQQVLPAGGDFYDVISVGDGITDYVVADASGHDLGSSIWTATLKALLAEYATPLNTPQEICRAINKALLRILPEGIYFTAVYARLNRRRKQLTLVNAGHPPAFWILQGKSEVTVLEQDGDVIGIFPDAVYNVLEMRVRPGDYLFLYSDGLVELEGLGPAGARRLEEACLQHRNLPLEEAVPRIVREACGGAVPSDDIVFLGICV